MNVKCLKLGHFSLNEFVIFFYTGDDFLFFIVESMSMSIDHVG